MARHAHRAHVYSVNGERLRSIPRAEAQQMVDDGFALRLSRLKSDVLVIKLKYARNERTDPATITKAEMEANVGQYGPRRTKRNRIGNFVDRAMTKIEIWPEVFDTRAVRVGPRVTRRG